MYSIKFWRIAGSENEFGVVPTSRVLKLVRKVGWTYHHCQNFPIDYTHVYIANLTTVVNLLSYSPWKLKNDVIYCRPTKYPIFKSKTSQSKKKRKIFVRALGAPKKVDFWRRVDKNVLTFKVLSVLPLLEFFLRAPMPFITLTGMKVKRFISVCVISIEPWQNEGDRAIMILNASM